jgi:hypothetical protein
MFHLVLNKPSKRTIRPPQLPQHKRLFGCSTLTRPAAFPVTSASFSLFDAGTIADRVASFIAAAAARVSTCTRIHLRY